MDSFNSAVLNLFKSTSVSTEKVVRHARRVTVLYENSQIHDLYNEKSTSSDVLFRGGEGWIRTTEVTDNRFTVCSLWPLGNLSIGAGDRNRTNNLLITNQLLCLLSYTSVFSCWCLGADSNHRHRDFQSLALPPELPRHIVREEPCISYRHYRQDEVIFDWCGHKVRFFEIYGSDGCHCHILDGDPEGARTPDLQRDRLAY